VLAEAVFFSFAEIGDPSRHRDYNEWHQLDHRPENLALDGVRHGERWVRTPACAATSRIGDDRLTNTHYANMYWFREPWQQSFTDWQGLAERSYQWGRRPEIAYTERPLMGLFRTVRGWTAPRVGISPDALPFRPVQAVHLSLFRFNAAHSADTHAYLADAELRRIPARLEVAGVAGVWSFSSMSTTLDPSWRPVPGSATFDANGSDAGLFRAEVSFLDGPTDAFQAELDTQAQETQTAGTEVFSSLLLPIRAWEWDWFDNSPSDEVGVNT
jgi:hypothetical protein